MDSWFIAEGRLWRSDAHGEVREIDSPFVHEALRRDERSRQVDGWKSAQDDGEGGRMVSRAALWGAGRGGPASAKHRFSHVTRGDGDEIYYVVDVDRNTGLFRYHANDGREVRLFHGASMYCLGLTYDPSSQHLVLAAAGGGTACLEIVDREGRRRGAITGGDAIDSAPSVSAHEPGVVYYQSSGVARHAQSGHVAAIGPAAVLRLDTRSAKLETVVEHRDFDHLAPRHDASGNLWYIRRPYERTVAETAFDAGKSALLFPWRVVKGVFGFLDTFSRVFGRDNGLRTSGGPSTHAGNADLGTLWLHGRMIALNEVRYDTGRGGGLVPASWELVCRNRRGEEHVAARHVVSFDVGAGGAVIYSNGFAAYGLADGDWREVARAHLMQAVCVA